ncbi:uncharacterized protein TM35_001021030 [Trypanosoma theileri]|uniref:Mucin-associated surface protein (MASP) n=1 Tax=Trypanosoma theileri TaxID=67003 RepID=A0A1X0NE91_9TRYP|nr:uncharacterized protein TM35_001021030 [Trypanosoma theileri]ORC81938.1 hypothetical protein TM35_001021030 [Trypanosoma theileri]
MMSRVLCFLALLLSVVSLCVTAVADSASVPLTTGGKCPDGYTTSAEGEPCTPAGPPVPHPPPSHAGGACPEDEANPQCKNKNLGSEDARPYECTEVTGKGKCVTNASGTQEKCIPNTESTCPPKEPAPRGDHSTTEDAGPGSEAGAAASTSSIKETSPAKKPDEVQADRAPPASSPAAPAAAEESGVPSVREGQDESSNNTAGGTPQNKESTGQQPSSSSTNTVTESVGSSETSPGNDNTSAESEAPSNPEGDVGNTTTTTTTTTVPPELTNNKKGDADSSSSIISSVWVRVPLLIVVTLACILVC